MVYVNRITELIKERIVKTHPIMKSLVPRLVLIPMGSRLELNVRLTFRNIPVADPEAVRLNPNANIEVVAPMIAARGYRELKRMNIGVTNVKTNARMYPIAKNFETVS